ncbi:unnamed protein product [Owenia fusiformis]|uniref:Aminotransferase class I/classII large domain-containing protein n=1 Tax=Owenia fusiformis TaxID=6347 RepID=A0A8J1U042_OWEFU|nr:unnamed protein product [Owenia fusiformis]
MEKSLEFLSLRGQNTVKCWDHHILGKFGCEAKENAYDKDRNSQGIINFGTADNKLCEDIIKERLMRPDMNKFDETMQHYFQFHGGDSFRQTLAEFLREKAHANQGRVSANDIFVTSGVASAFDILAHAICDPGDTLLIPSPHYAGMEHFHQRGQVNLYRIPLSSTGTDKTSSFHLSADMLKTAYQNAVNQGQKVRGIILTNPNNPLGDIYDVEQLYNFLEFAHSKKLHVIMDEIFALSVFDEHSKFHSLLRLHLMLLPDPWRIHTIWGFSKDLGLSGLRCGVVHTKNPQIQTVFKSLTNFGAVPPVIQHKLNTLLRDKDWLDKTYLPTNIDRLRSNYKIMTETLDSFNISYRHSKAGFFLFADFSKYLHPPSKESEMDLFERFIDGGVYMVPGCAHGWDTFGWFRVVFTSTSDKDIIIEGVKRINDVLNSIPDQFTTASSSSNHGNNRVESEASVSGELKGVKRKTPTTPDTTDDFDFIIPQPLSKDSGPEDPLEGMLKTLKQQITTSGWLDKNTSDQWEASNPDTAKAFRKAAGKDSSFEKMETNSNDSSNSKESVNT